MKGDKNILKKKMQDSRKVIREAFEKYGVENVRCAWTGGKDSTLVLYLIKQVCDKDGVALPCCFNIDEGDMFPEVGTFLQKVSIEWAVDVRHIHNNNFT